MRTSGGDGEQDRRQTDRSQPTESTSAARGWSRQAKETLFVGAAVATIASVILTLYTLFGDTHGTQSPDTSRGSTVSTSTRPPASGGTQPPGPVMIAHGNALISIADADGYDIDTLRPANSSDDEDVSAAWNFVNQTVDTSDAVWMAYVDGLPPTYAGCVRAQNRTNSIDVGGDDQAIDEGERFCVMTRKGNLALLTFVKLDGSDATNFFAEFQAVVWIGTGR